MSAYEDYDGPVCEADAYAEEQETLKREMTMAAPARKIELKNAGDEVFLSVQSCEKWKVGEMKFPEAKWTGTDGNGHLIAVHMPWSSAERQLDRLKRTMASIAGATVKISRDHNPGGNPWWGVNLVDDMDMPGEPTAAARATHDEPPDDDTPHPATRMDSTPLVQKGPGNGTSGPPEPDLYMLLTVATLRDIAPLYVKAGFPPTATDIKEMVAARFIAASPKRY